nr:helix-turn-helix transcriptional regulator [uncultured Dorea sp.]
MYEQNLSVRQVSRLTGISTSTIEKVMREDSNPTIRTLNKIAKGLNIPITDLFTDH